MFPAQNRVPTDYTWNGEAFVRRQREQNRSETVDGLGVVLGAYTADMSDLSERLRDGTISLEDWEAEMIALVMMIHLTSTALAVGGWEQMTSADTLAAQEAGQSQVEYLILFAIAIAAGTVVLDGRFLARVRLYGQAGRGTYWSTVGRVMGASGYTQEQRVLHPADHCRDCVEYADRGWQAIGTLPTIGDSQCRSNCRCSFEYR